MAINKEKKYIAVAIVAILVVAALVAAYTLGGSNEASDGKYTIRASVNYDCSGTPFYVGTDIGYFKANDINFVNTGATSYAALTSLLVNNQNDIYTGHPITLFNLLAAGVKIKGVVMTGYEPSDFHPEDANAPKDSQEYKTWEEKFNQLHMHILARESSNIKTIKDLADYRTNVLKGGKVTVGVLAEGVCADLEAETLLKNELGWTKGTEYQFKVIGDGLQVTEITDPTKNDGSIDVAVLHPPFYTAAEAIGGVNVIATSYDAFGEYGGVSLLVFTEDFIKKNPDSVKAFAKAFKDAERWSNDHRREAGLLTQYTIGLDAAAAHYYSYSGEITEASINYWIEAAKKVGDKSLTDFKNKYGRDLQASDVYTTEFKELWKEPESPQPLNPYGSDTNARYKWLNKTSDLVESNTFVSELTEQIDYDIVSHYGATIQVVQPLTGRE